MITVIPARPGALGFAISGRVTRADYRQVLLPPVRAAIANGEQIRVLVVIDHFEGLDPGPLLDELWAAARLGRDQRSLDARFAVVSDTAWARHGITLIGGLIPGEVRHFNKAHRAEAEAWLMKAKNPS